MASPVTGCECPEPGWCQRHGVQKSPHWHHLCQTHPEYFAIWEAGTGPGQAIPGGQGLGDKVEQLLSAVGITQERYVAVKGAFGLKGGCGCAKRKALLNKIGARLGIGD
jgi:hypothetical protein